MTVLANKAPFDISKTVALHVAVETWPTVQFA